MTPTLAAALDRTKTSSRSASHILIAAAAGLGLNVDNINLSSSAIHAKRIKLRAQFLSELKENIQLARSLVIHWDGKLLADIDSSTIVERLPVVVSGLGTEQLLGVPKLDTGTGVNQATAIIETIDEWSVSGRIKAMCFDTTSVNTG